MTKIILILCLFVILSNCNNKTNPYPAFLLEPIYKLPDFNDTQKEIINRVINQIVSQVKDIQIYYIADIQSHSDSIIIKMGYLKDLQLNNIKKYNNKIGQYEYIDRIITLDYDKEPIKIIFNNSYKLLNIIQKRT
jgi:hypothetical protein